MKLVIYINKNKSIKKLAVLEKMHDEISDIANVEIVITENQIKDDNITHMNSADVLIIFAHGGPDKIYHDYTNSVNSNDIIIDKTNANIFSNKKVIVFSCYTARELGPYAVDSENCTCYLGFYDAMYRELKNKKKTPPQVEYFFNSIYSEAFKNTIVNAINRKFTFNQIKKYLEIEIRRLLTSQVINCGINTQRFKASLIPEITFSASKTIEGIMCFGDDSIPLW